jgi:predicted O-methyltransferase YrrM
MLAAVRRAQFASLVATIRLDPGRFVQDIALAREAVARNAAQKATELAPLIALLRRRRLRAVLEIGTERGGTLYVWTRLAEPDALLISVDWPEAAVRELAGDDELRAMGRERQQIDVVRGDSHADGTRARIERTLAGRRLDVLFVDGDHSYRGVRRDFELYSPLVRGSGLIVFHDILRHHSETGSEVERFWQEIRCGYRSREFVDDESEMGFGPWGGIGVLLWPGSSSGDEVLSTVPEGRAANRGAHPSQNRHSCYGV